MAEELLTNKQTPSTVTIAAHARRRLWKEHGIQQEVLWRYVGCDITSQIFQKTEVEQAKEKEITDALQKLSQKEQDIEKMRQKVS